MKFLLFLMKTAAAISLQGHWNQLYSNKYVQLTTEIDWKCIHVYVNVSESSKEMTYYKKASLHGGPQTVTTPEVHAHLHNDATKFTVSDKNYDVHPYSKNTVIITGEDHPSFYVWQSSSEEKNDDPVDIPRLMVFVKQLGLEKQPQFSVNNMIPTFDKTCFFLKN